MTPTSGPSDGDQTSPTVATCLVMLVPSPRHCNAHIVVSGDVDILTAPGLDRRLHDHHDTLPVGGSLLVDLSRVGHFSAAGVHVLQRVAATACDRHVTVQLGPLSRQVRRVLDVCGVDFTATGGTT